MHMELKNFVAETLKQIAEGIKEAQAANTGAWIVPRIVLKNGYQHIDTSNKGEYIPEFVSFDVAVSATEGTQAEGSGGIRVLSAQLGGNIDASTQNTTVSRIQFRISVDWPKTPAPGS